MIENQTEIYIAVHVPLKICLIDWKELIEKNSNFKVKVLCTEIGL